MGDFYRRYPERENAIQHLPEAEMTDRPEVSRPASQGSRAERGDLATLLKMGLGPMEVVRALAGHPIPEQEEVAVSEQHKCWCEHPDCRGRKIDHSSTDDEIARMAVERVGEAHVAEAVTATSFGHDRDAYVQYWVARAEIDRAIAMMQQRRQEIVRRMVVPKAEAEPSEGQVYNEWERQGRNAAHAPRSKPAPVSHDERGG